MTRQRIIWCGLLLLAVGFAVQTFAPPITTISTVAELQGRKPATVGETVILLGYHVAGDHDARVLTHVASDTGATNRGNRFRGRADTGIYRAKDSTNALQDLRWWGAKPDGTTPIDGSVSQAVEWIQGLGGGELLIPGGTWKTTNTTEITGSTRVDLTLGQGCVINGTTLDDYAPIFRISGSASSPVSLVAAATAGSITLTLSADLGLLPGDWLRMSSTNLWNRYRPAYFAGEDMTVRSVSNGTNVTLELPLQGSYSVGDSVRLITPAKSRIQGPGRLALGTMGWGIMFRYAQDIVVEGVEMTGSEDTHIYLSGVRHGDIRRCRIWEESGEGTGLGYGITTVASEGITISGCVISTSRHAVTFGAGDSDAVAPIVNRHNLVEGNWFGGYGTNAASVDFHGNNEHYTISRNFLRRGFSIAGSDGAVLDNVIGNPVSQPAGVITEQVSRQFTIARNRFRIQTGPLQTVFLLRDRIERASATGASTNSWTGSHGTAKRDAWSFTDNLAELTDVTNLSANVKWVFVDAEANLPASIEFGSFDCSRNKVVLPGATTSALADGLGLFLEPHSQVSWGKVTCNDNDWGPLSVTLSANTRQLQVGGNTWRDSVASSINLLLRGTTAAVPTFATVFNNQVDGTAGSALYLLDVTGHALVLGNSFRDWARGDSSGAIGFGASAVSATNLASLRLDSNTYRHTNTARIAVVGSSSGTILTHNDEDTGGLTHLSVTVAGRSGLRLGSDAAILQAGTGTNTFRVDTTSATLTGLPLSIGRLTTSALNGLTSLPDGTMAWNTTLGSMVYLTGGTWTTFGSGGGGSGGSTFDSITVTNTAAIGGVVKAARLSVSPRVPSTDFSTDTTPGYWDANTNAVLNLKVVNGSTNTAALAGVRVATGDTDGALWLGTSNYNSSPYAGGNIGLVSVTGGGVFLAADANDTIRFWLGANSLLGATTNDFNISSATTSVRAPTASTTSKVLVVEADPSSSARPIKTRTLTELATDMGIPASSLVSINGATNSAPNFNGSTPAAPSSGGNNIAFQVAGNNVSGYVPFGPWSRSATQSGWTNTISEGEAAVITLPSLSVDGQLVVLECFGYRYNFSGSTVNYTSYAHVNGAKFSTGTQLSTASSTNYLPFRAYIALRRLSATNAAALYRADLGATTTGGSGGWMSTSLRTEISGNENIPITWSATTNTMAYAGSWSTANTNIFTYVNGYTAKIE